MCKFTYLGYAGCEEPERHYLIRREKCSAKAHLKHWCGPNEQDESAPADEESRLNLECPMCADVPVVYDQPLLEIAHSRRSVLPAPHYDAVTGKYSRLGRHHAQHSNHIVHAHHAIPTEPSASLVPKPLNPARMQYDRSASETAVDRIKEREVSSNYRLPAATYAPSLDERMEMPAAHYLARAHDVKLPMALPMPQAAEPTPPSSREASLSPPQSRMGHALRAIPPGESSRRELESIRDRQRAAVLPRNQGRPGTDRSRSGSESSTSSSFSRTNPPPPPPPRMPSRKPSTASSTASAESSTPSQGGSVGPRHGRPRHHRKDSTSTSASASASSSSSASRSPPESGADRFATAALRTIGLDRTASPERGRRPHRRERGGSSSERSDSPSVWRPTISPPRLQQDSLGMGPGADLAQSFKQRLVPFAPSKGGASPGRPAEVSAPRARTAAPPPNNNGTGARQAPVLRLYPNKSDDEKVAQGAFDTMFREEQKALYAAQTQTRTQTQTQTQASPPRAKKTVNFAQRADGPGHHPDEETLTEVDMQTAGQLARGGGDPYHAAGVGRRAGGAGAGAGDGDKVLPSVPTTTTTAAAAAVATAGLRRIKTGQVKTVTVAPPRPPKRANTVDSSSGALAAAPSSMTSAPAPAPAPAAATATATAVRAAPGGGPLFKFAGVSGTAREFEIVSGGASEVGALGQAF